ncbi:MAG TPA: M15 family metallopeptidase [bacterium]|nr:M15 family metallopeptidase [bacterium]
MDIRSRTLAVLNLVVACAVTTALVISAPGAPATGAGTGFLQSTMGTDAWWIAMVQISMEQLLKVHIPAAPAPYPGHGLQRRDKKTDEMLADLNQEFAKRLNVLMAVYQASGGDKRPSVVEPLGITEGDGGLRSSDKQHELYKECRRLKTGANGKPVGDGSKPEDWEEVPPTERVGDPTGQKLVPYAAPGVPAFGWTLQPTGGKKNCHLFEEVKVGNIIYEIVGPVTWTWDSWHNFGLAVDLAERIQVAGQKEPPRALPGDPKGGPGGGDAGRAWNNVYLAAEAFGMVLGARWDKDRDPGHFEWHPKLHHIKPAPGTSGKALGPDKVDAGYSWKIPQKIYEANSSGLTVASVSIGALRVFELVEDRGWIAVRGEHYLTGEKDKAWTGSWLTFDPPIRLFPAFIPTDQLSLSGDADPRWQGITTVTRVHYEFNAHPSAINYYKDQVRVSYSIVATVHDFLKEADAHDPAHHPSEAARYKRVWDHYVYAVYGRAGILADAKGQRQHRQVSGGCSFDDKGEAAYRRGDPLVWDLHLAWNRDTGAVGGWVGNVGSGNQPVYDIVPDVGKGDSVYGALPQGAWDIPTAPPLPTASPCRTPPPPPPSPPSPGLQP